MLRLFAMFILAQERALFSSEAVVCDKREKARSLVVPLKEPVSRRIFPKNIFCALCYLSVCCLAIVGQTWSEALLFPSGSQLSEVVLLNQTFYTLFISMQPPGGKHIEM